MTAIVLIILAVAFIINVSCGAATTYHFKKMCDESFEENNRKRERALRESAKKANVYYNPIGHYFECDKNYDGTMKK